MLIDGNGGPPLEETCLLLRGRDILAVGRRASTGIPDDALVFDVGGKTLLPGLIDGYVHLRAYAGNQRSDFCIGLLQSRCCTRRKTRGPLSMLV
ncbi:MAG TPA: hypothetical protein VGK33_14500 [Chloroflexota bacterium]